MPERMPIVLQRLQIKADLKRAGIEPDLVDVDALIDPSLSYPENLAIVRKHATGRSSKAKKAPSKDEEEERSSGAHRTYLQRLGFVHVNAYDRHKPGHAHDHPRCHKCAFGTA